MSEELNKLKEQNTQDKIASAILHEVDDSDWVCSMFAIPNIEEYNIYEKEERYRTVATEKIGGSAIDAGRVMNMPPGINEFCDIPLGYGVEGVRTGGGMGVFYAEGFDNNLDVVHIKPGVPRNNPIARFYEATVQAAALKATDYGWFDSMLYTVSSFVGSIVTLPFRIIAAPFNILRRLTGGDTRNHYSYYYLSPAPFLFWNALDNMVNDFALRSGVIPGMWHNSSFDDGGTDGKALTDEDLKYFIDNIPGVFKTTKFGIPRIDVLAISKRYQIIANRREKWLLEKRKELGNTEGVTTSWETAWNQVLVNHNPWGEDKSAVSMAAARELSLHLANASASMANIYDKINNSVLPEEIQEHEVVYGEDGTMNTVISNTANLAGVNVEPPKNERKLNPELDDQGFTESMLRVLEGGADHVSFAVDYIEESTIKINNSSGPSGIAETINGLTSSMRSKHFMIGNGNIGDGAIGQTLEGIVNSVGAAFSGLTGAFLGDLPSAIFGGKAFIDIPDVYQSSSVELDSISYTLTSVATSGHPVAKLRMLMPYFALLILASPRSAGPTSYSPPFLVEVQHKGKVSVDLGMIDSLTATFGADTGWDLNNIPNSVKIEFSIVNLSKGFHVPLDSEAALTYKDQGGYIRHLSVLAGASLSDLKQSRLRNLKLYAMRKAQTIDKYTDPETWGHMVGAGLKSIDVLGFQRLLPNYVNKR